MVRKSVIVAAMGLVTVTAFGAVLDATAIVWKPKAGATYKFKFKAATQIQGQPLTITSDMLETIKDVKSDGTVVTEEKQTNFSVMVGSQDMSSQSPVQTVTETITEKLNGEVLDRKSDAPAGSTSPRMAALNQFSYPDHAMNPGDSWTYKVKGDKAKGTYDADLKYTFQGQETVDGFLSNKIAVELKETQGDTPMTANGTVWMDTDGQLVKVTMKVQNADLGPAGTSDMDLAIDRV